VELDELRAHGVVMPSTVRRSDDDDISTRRPEWLTVPELAQAVGISTGTAYELIRRGEVRPVRRFGRLIRVHRDVLQALDRRTT
jgi:excisionase family DNA binding protein